MGYRSDGKLYLSEKAQELLPKELKESLELDWDNNGEGMYSFYYWKWYTDYEDVRQWYKFFRTLDASDEVDENDYDLLVIGEDYAVVEHLTQTKFFVNISIGIL